MNKEIDKTSCWYQTFLYSSMNLAIINHPPLSEIGHGKEYKSKFNSESDWASHYSL